MNKEFVTYEQALALKELGFDESCFAVYSEHDKTRVYDESAIREGLKIQAPLYQQAFRWFREKYGMHHGIGFNGSWYYDIDSMKNCDEGVYEVAHKWDMETYEEAEQACLDELIEIVKKNAHI